MAAKDQRQSLRLVRQIPCALRVKPTGQLGAGTNTPSAQPLEVRLASLATEFDGYCDQISHRPTQNALRALQRQVDHLHSAVTTNLAQQEGWTQQLVPRQVSLSFDGLEIALQGDDRVPPDADFLEVLLNISGIPALICTLKLTAQRERRVLGSFEQIADADLRRLRRYLLLQDAAQASKVSPA